MFRYKLILERGGWWVDLDTVCLRPFDLDLEHVFASEPDGTVANGTFRASPEPGQPLRPTTGAARWAGAAAGGA